ncbi:hypothetical protein [Risungbinella massiliensis]|uniref:hypothetical protein n=1 Tax=Risungbinella massiliensis TaxID=1329796 RepID=UPI0005CB8DFB|nr:hypothetical protein [Risungbinella massiliensis]
MYDPKKGKYSSEEDAYIIQQINASVEKGGNERAVMKEISEHLNRGFAGIMSHVRKLRTQYPDKFIVPESDGEDGAKRLNSWDEKEEELLIETVNETLKENKSLSVAIQTLEKSLNRTQGAIYQRIYTLRRKYPDKFTHLPTQRPRRPRKLPEWQFQRPVIRNLDENFSQPIPSLNPQPFPSNSLNYYSNMNWNLEESESIQEEQMVYQAYEERYGRLPLSGREKLTELMRQYGCTRVSISLLTLHEESEFSPLILELLHRKLQK